MEADPSSWWPGCSADDAALKAYEGSTLAAVMAGRAAAEAKAKAGEAGKEAERLKVWIHSASWWCW